MTIAEAQTTCNGAEPLKVLRHPLEAPELTLRQTFHPLGFAVDLRTNHADVLAEAAHVWGMFPRRFSSPPLTVDVHVVDSEMADCPPAPSFRILQPLLVSFADADNYCVVDLQRGSTQMVVSSSTLAHSLYFRYFFLEGAAACHIATRFTTPVHAACVALDGRGILLCGDSGAGKSTLAYSCARRGWQYVTDDGSYLLHGPGLPVVVGNGYKLRLRPSAADLFPEISELAVTPRAAGKPSIELTTASNPRITRVESAEVGAVVFLNRRSGGKAQLLPYSKDLARVSMRSTLFGSPESLALHSEALERLLCSQVLELRYTDLAGAVDRLRSLIKESR